MISKVIKVWTLKPTLLLFWCIILPITHTDGIVIPDNANVDCYYDAFNEANITSLLIGERGHSRKTSQ